MTEPLIYVRSFGGLGNRMIRYMFAEHLSRLAGGIRIVGYDMPEWGLVSAERDIPPGRGLATGRVHKIDVDAIVAQLRSGAVDWIDVDCFAMRLEYFADARERFASLFTSEVAGCAIGDDEIVINVRSGEIIDGLHPDYTPIPAAYYHRVVFETGLTPVFVGQVTGNWYADALRRQFGQARFVQGGALADFQTVRRAKAVMIAVSSFSWLAAFLSAAAEQIHMPVAGLFNPERRPDIDLLPAADQRYVFHRFPAETYTGHSQQRAVIVSPPAMAQAAPPDTSYLGMRAAPLAPKILSMDEAASRFRSAAVEGRPFCFVRLGDGEGNLLQLDPATATDTDIGYFREHFGAGASIDTMLAVRDGLRRTLDAADLIGLRDEAWLATERVATLSENDPDFLDRFRAEFPLRRSERGIHDHGARRMFRLFAWAREFYPASIDACSTWVGYDLAAAGFWRDFLRAAGTIGLIHCSPHLPAKLEGALGIRVQSFLVPDKAVQRAQWALPDQPPHYPDAFLRICDRLDRSVVPGRVYLVGAGIAGKEYLRLIKAKGGVALDLGALLDAWDDRATRPQVYFNKSGDRWNVGDPVPSAFRL